MKRQNCKTITKLPSKGSSRHKSLKVYGMRIAEASVQKTTNAFSADTSANSYLPLGINMAGVKCLIAGGGRVAARKSRTLLEAGAKITVLSPAISQELTGLVQNDSIEWIKDEYHQRYLGGYDFIIAATSEPRTNDEVAKDAEQLGLLYCVVSSGKNSRVIFPAVYRNGQLTVAVHSNGTNCRRSKAIRNRIAEYMARQERQAQQLIAFGFDRNDISHEAFRLLLDLTGELSREDFGRDQMLILSTCRRWQCHIQSDTARELYRQLIERIGYKLGKSWPGYRTLIQYRTGHSAYYELLRISLGLDSPFVGETEIVDQIRSAMSQWLSSEKCALGESLSSVLLNTAKIRNISGLTCNRGKWSKGIADLLQSRFGNLRDKKILVIGNGRLSRSVIQEIINQDCEIINFSRRFADSKDDQFSKNEVASYHTNELGRFLHCSDALIVCSELTAQATNAVKQNNDFNRLFVVDMEGYRELFQEIPEDRYYDTASIPTPKFDSEKLKAVFVVNIKAFEQTLIWYGLRQPVYTDLTVLRIGARSSELSKAQVAEIEKLLRALNENMVFEQVYYDTPGDRDKDTPLPEASSDDFFTRDIDEALLAGEIDIAVHSTKDLPEKLRTGLRIAAITPSMAPWDCLVSKNDLGLMELPAGAAIGTSSIKRKENVARLRPDLKTVDIRGDVPERIKQLDEDRFDVLILASVGLLRLGLADRITEIFSKSSFPYTPGQGSLSLVTRENDSGLIDFLRPLDLGQGCFKQ